MPSKVVKLHGALNLVSVILELNPVFCECVFSCLGCNGGRDLCDQVRYLNFLKNNIQESLPLHVLASCEPTQRLISTANKSVIQPLFLDCQ